MKQKLKQAYMKTAETFAELSHARRLHVGAIVVKDDRIISIGYNGMPAGWDNNCEDESVELYSGFEGAIHRTVLKTKPEVLHAEMNALMKLAKSNESGDGATMFITHAPCMNCAKGMFQSGIKQVFYKTEYRDNAGLDFLNKCGVTVEKLDE
jgi:dCMP deaminase